MARYPRECGVKPPPFEYDAPTSLDEALALLAAHGDEVKVLAGGQSLLPLLNFRLVRPARLLDLNRVAELAYLRSDDGRLRIGSMVRSRTLERSREAGNSPLLQEAVGYSGHPQIRNRGTVGGSCAHADPAAELPCALLALDARLRLRSLRAERVVHADEFFVSTFTTALRPDELLVEVEVPAQQRRTGTAFLEHARVHGDFALAGAAAVVTVGDDGVVERAALSLLGVADRPVRRADAERALAGRPFGADGAREAAAVAVAGLEPLSDLRASGAYRNALAQELVRRAVLTAGSRAR
ncbi:MAG: FAD binding domain-containing protein [Actinomycetota bacterium]|nr:FAD binding domain-containing protein [Actinomycetota bacterium]